MYSYNYLPRQDVLPYVTNIEDLTLKNDAYRRVIWTGNGLQLVVMSIPPLGEISLERHEFEDQFIRIEKGRAWATVGPSEQNLNQQWILEDDDIIIIPRGYTHYIKNIANTPLKIYTIYAPPHHPANLVQQHSS